MRICFFRIRRTRKLLIIPKRYLAVPAALACVFALCSLVNLPGAVTTAAGSRQLPIYCVQKDTKTCSLSFDAAWGNAILRRRDFNGLRAGFWNKPEPGPLFGFVEVINALCEASLLFSVHVDTHGGF